MSNDFYAVRVHLPGAQSEFYWKTSDGVVKLFVDIRAASRYLKREPLRGRGTVVPVVIEERHTA
jgi:hypothetical protein